jgi:hypothetical protein
MQPLDVHEKELSGLSRGVRAAIVMPLLFALALVAIGQPEMAGLAAFGTFGHLVMVDYSPDMGARSMQAGTLTILGTILLSSGAVASANLWFAVPGAVAGGFLAKYPAAGPEWARSHVATLRPALLMAFMLAVAVPTPLRALPLQLSG